MSSPSERSDILISGGSFAGLVLALALAQALEGISITVIDPKLRGEADPALDDPRAFATSASSQRLLETIGIWATIADMAQAVSEILDLPQVPRRLEGRSIRLDRRLSITAFAELLGAGNGQLNRIAT